MKAYIKNLTDQIGQPEPLAIALCKICGSEYSANKGDYWYLLPEESIVCCGNSICELVTKETVYKQV